MTKKLKPKLHVRDNIVDFLLRTERFLKQYDPANHALQVQSRIDKLDEKWDEFEEAQTQIEEMEEHIENVNEHKQTRAQFEELYFKVRAELKAKLPSTTPITSPTSTGTSRTEACGNIQLPKINLPEFNGEFDKWLPFYDTFKSLIHSNPDLSAIQRFHYLRASLKGEALKVVDTFPMSEASYGVAWSALTKRYSNVYLQKKRHVNALLQYPKLKKMTASGIHDVIDCFDRHLKILDLLGEATTGWGAMLTQLLVSKLDDATLKEWEKFAVKREEPAYLHVMEFLEVQIRILDAIAVDQSSENQRAPPLSMSTPFKKPAPKLSVHAASEGYSPKCVSCSGPHYLSNCPQFVKMPLDKRFQVVNSKKLCSNCLRRDHYSRDCNSKYRCRTCSKKHHTLLHPGPSAFGSGSAADAQVSDQSQSGSSVSSTTTTATVEIPRQSLQSSVATIYAANISADSREAHIFLSTVLVSVKDRNGRLHTARALLDTDGSQANLISERLFQLLKLPRNGVNIPISGVGSARVQINGSVSATIGSRISDYSVPMDFLVIKKVTEDQPSTTIPIGNWNLPSDMALADPGFNKRASIDLLLGLEYFYEFLLLNSGRVQIQRIGEGLPLFVNTVFGWIAAGKADLGSLNPVPCCHATINTSTLEEKIERFWTIEELQDVLKLTQEEQDCEEHFQNTFYRYSTGRYVVRLPKRMGFEQMIGESKDMALQRLLQLERRFEKDSMLRNRYNEAIQAYLDQNHMAIVPEKELKRDKRIACYLPHHPVFKESSSTTKIRPVFDGSAKTTSNRSLNDALMTGPVIQDSLFDLLVRFRKHLVALVADIEKMYLQVMGHFWVSAIVVPRHTVFTALAHDEGDQFPQAKTALVFDFCVDDYIGGVESEEKAILLRQELVQLLSKGGFRLHKWVSNSKAVLSELDSDELGTSSTLSFDQERVKTLGISWQPGPDLLSIDVSGLTVSGQWTRRKVYSVIAQLFDPTGLTAPVIAWDKIRMQLLWVATQGWDDPLSPDLEKQWADFYQQLPSLANVKVDRHAFTDHPVPTEFHVFSDASEAAYGACIYGRSSSMSGQIKVELLAAKSLPASLKKATLARLELCGAHIAAKLYSATVRALKMEEIKARFWSDSTIVLSWLKLPPYVWPTFVANRVSHIQEITKRHQWNHVKGTENSADLVSRGVMPKDLAELPHWFHGPHWLSLLDQHWNTREHLEYEQPADELLKKKKNVLVVTEHGQLHPLLDRYSCYCRMLRITAYCVRFVRSCQRRRSLLAAPMLNVKDLQEAKYALVRGIQWESFAVEIKALVNHRAVPASSSLKLLNPFLDQHGILRVGGRLNLAEESYAVRHPMIIPGNHSFSRQVAVAYHEISLHSGPRITLAQIRQESWPINGKALATYTFRHCIRCFRAKPVPVSQPPGQYPKSRTTPSRAFTVIPPRAPNFGGLWEAAVKSAKTSLIRVLGQRQLSFEDMTTVLTQIEAGMNSRPLTPLSEDPGELDVLTPGHFLTGTSLLAIPDPDYTDVPTNRLQHYQQLQQLVQHHWKRLKREYISQLHNQNQRFLRATPLKVGQMVVLKEDGSAAIEWPLARIIEIYPGPDGVVRVVKVRTPTGAVYKRQAARVCLLPFENV
ncbi:uncharacterized protein LOC129717145 [Wyeomyia smithii]|uniref:uncharacterized protein LOC129717145 n=1 Tax=Wyeomyia smithii TaxID=174621 RepID=UPI002467BBFD|nr:uncharacterized protein LOC129717145 [Wyeomyia smithii]